MPGKADLRASAFVAKRITSAANETIKTIGLLRLRKHRSRSGLFVAEGLRTIIQAGELGIPARILVYADRAKHQPALRRAIEVTRSGRGECIEVTDQILERISGRDNPQTALGVFEQRWERLDTLRIDTDFCWVVLESIKDPGNLGTILRTCDAVGGAGVILLDQTCDPFSLEAVRASMGSIFAQRVVRARSEEFIAWRKGQRGTLIGTALHAATDYQNVRYAPPLLLLMGNEQSGLPANLSTSCDLLVKIPMRGRADSLNLAVATSLMLYESFNQNRP